MTTLAAINNSGQIIPPSPNPNWIWNGYQWIPPRQSPITGFEPWIEQGTTYEQWLKKQSAKRRIVIRRPGTIYSPPYNPNIDSTTNPVETLPTTTIPATVPPTGTTTETTAAEDLLFGFPRNYVYIAGAGLAAVVVIYLMTAGTTGKK